MDLSGNSGRNRSPKQVFQITLGNGKKTAHEGEQEVWMAGG